MKKSLLAALMVMVIWSIAEADWIPGKWIRGRSFIENRWFPGQVIGGEELEENEWGWWVPVSADSGASVVLRGTGGWALDSSAPPSVAVQGAQMLVFGFDADGGSTGDDVVYLSFPIPAQYETDSLRIDLYWFHLDDNGAAADTVTWDGTAQAAGEGEDLFAAGTAMAAVTEVCTAADSALYITTLNPEVETITAADLVTIKLWCDESASSLDSGELAYLIGVYIRLHIKNDD